MSKMLYFNTVNHSKIAEITEIFKNFDCELKFMQNNILEVLSNDITTVIKAKAADAYKKCRVPIIVEHGSLCIEYFNNFPGALSKPMWDLMGSKICKLIPAGESRKATVYSGVCYCDGKIRKTFIGETKGTITEEERGTLGFQWDPIFIPEGATITYAEMKQTEKLTFSQAVKAYNFLIKELDIKVKKAA